MTTSSKKYFAGPIRVDAIFALIFVIVVFVLITVSTSLYAALPFACIFILVVGGMVYSMARKVVVYEDTGEVLIPPGSRKMVSINSGGVTTEVDKETNFFSIRMSKGRGVFLKFKVSNIKSIEVVPRSSLCLKKWYEIWFSEGIAKNTVLITFKEPLRYSAERSGLPAFYNKNDLPEGEMRSVAITLRKPQVFTDYINFSREIN